jgi:hypothetical protein
MDGFMALMVKNGWLTRSFLRAPANHLTIKTIFNHQNHIQPSKPFNHKP